MSRQTRILSLILIPLFLVGLLLWLTLYNRGTLTINLSEPFLVDAKSFARISCEESPCSLEIPFGEREICLEKEGYFPVCQTFFLALWKEENWKPDLKRIPVLSESETREISPPNSLTDLEKRFAGWSSVTTEFGRFYAFNKLTNDLLEFSHEAEGSLVASFLPLKNPTLSAWGENILVKDEGILYFVDHKRHKKQILFEGKNPTFRVLSPKRILIEDKGEVFVYEPLWILPRKLSFAENIDHTALCNDQWLYATTQEGVAFFFRRALDATEEGESIASVHMPGGYFFLECGEKEDTLRIISSDSEQVLSF